MEFQMKRKILDFEMPNIDAEWEKFQQHIRQNVIQLSPKTVQRDKGTVKEDGVLLRGTTDDNELSWVVRLDKTGKGTFLVLELLMNSETFDGQQVKITLPTAIASIGTKEYEALEILWANDPPLNIPSARLVKDKATQTRLGILKKNLSDQVRNQLVELLQPIEIEE